MVRLESSSFIANQITTARKRKIKKSAGYLKAHEYLELTAEQIGQALSHYF